MVEPIEKGVQGVIGSDGEYVKYPDDFANVTPEHAQLAMSMEDEIIQRCQGTKKMSFEIAALLSEFNRQRLYLARGYNSFKVWADSPELADIGYRTAHDYVRIIDELLPLLAEAGYDKEWPPMSTMRDILTVLGDDNAKDKVLRAMEAVMGQNTRAAKQTIREIRGLNPDPDKTGVVFTGRVKYGDPYHKVWIKATEEGNSYDMTLPNSPLMIEPKHWAKFSERFGRFLSIKTDD